MVFKHRNGRIDRYGQSETPGINCLLTDSLNQGIKGDTRIFQLLIEKDEQASKNIGDSASFMKLTMLMKRRYTKQKPFKRRGHLRN